MNITVTITVDLNVLQNASKCTISKEKIPKFFWGGAQPPPQIPPPLGMGILPPQTPSPSAPPFECLLEPPPNHISGYGPGFTCSSLQNASKDQCGCYRIRTHNFLGGPICIETWDIFTKNSPQLFWHWGPLVVNVATKRSLKQTGDSVPKWRNIKTQRTEQHHCDVFLKPLPSNQSGADVGACILVLYGCNV